MAWEINDVIEVKLKQDYLNEIVINVLHYVIATKVSNPVIATILTDLATQLVNVLVPIQNDALTHLEQTFDNLTDGSSFYVADIQANGAGSSINALASFYAVGMKKQGVSRITRPGSIRVAGMSEENFTGNTMAATFVTACNNAGNLLAGTAVAVDGAGGSMSFTPVIVGRTIFGTPDLTRLNQVEDVITPRITTQNSRKAVLGQF